MIFNIVYADTNITDNDSNNNISGIGIDVYIDIYGNAKVTQYWNIDTYSKTEEYKIYSDVDICNIANFNVTDSQGIEYENLGEWDLNLNFDEKAYRCGIIDLGDEGIQLCWGANNYENNKYTLTYTIENFVNQYIDSQGVDFSFILENMHEEIDHVVIRIGSDIAFSNENSTIYAFGYPSGTISYNNNYIVMDSKGTLTSSEYMSTLIQFENAMFQTDNLVEMTFEEVYTQKLENVDVILTDSSKNDIDSELTLLEKIKQVGLGRVILNILSLVGVILLMIVFGIVSFVFNPAGLLVIFIFVIIYIKIKKRRKKLGKLPKYKDAQYYRNIPCQSNIFKIYWIMREYIGDIATSRENLISAIMFKWLREKKIEITKTRQGLFSYEGNDFAIDISNLIIEDKNSIESKFAQMIHAASSDNILETYELEDWCQDNTDKIENIFADLTTTVYNDYLNDGCIEIIKNNKGKIKSEVFSNEIRKEANNILGLKKYLNDFSFAYQNENIQMNLLNYYLIFSILAGTWGKVKEQFKKITSLSENIDLNNDFEISINCAVKLGLCVQKGIYRYEKNEKQSR